MFASANIDEEKQIYLREILLNLIQEIDFSEEILRKYGFNNKQEMIKHVAKDGEKLGLDTLQILLDKCKIRIYIWYDNNISGKKWIILNKKLKDPDNPILYLNYKDYKDRFPHNIQLAEQYVYYDILINNENISIINQNKKAYDIIQKMISDQMIKRQQNQIKQKTPIKIMVWNTDSI